MKVTILSSKMFDELPYMGIRYSLGVADTNKNEAFIRKTGHPREDLDSIVHEISELAYPNKWHEGESGIFHKKWYETWWGKYALPAVASFIPVIGPAAAATIGGAGGYKRAKAAGGSGFLGGLLGAVQGYGIGGLAQGVKGAIRGAVQGGMKQIIPSFQSSWQSYNQPLTNLLGKVGVGSSGAGGAFSNLASLQQTPYSPWASAAEQFGSEALSSFAPGVASGAGTLASTLSATPLLGTMGLGSQGAIPWGKALLGASLLGASTMGETPTMPPISEINPQLYGEVTSRILGTSPMSAAAREELLGRITKSPAEYMSGMGMGPEAEDPYLTSTIDRINELKDQQLEAINTRAAQYGIYGGGWHREALRKAEESASEDIVQAQKESTWRAQQIGLELKTSAVADALNLNMSEARELMNLLQPEIAREAGLTEAEMTEQDELRQLLGTTGGQILSRALFPDQFGWLTSLVKRGIGG